MCPWEPALLEHSYRTGFYFPDEEMYHLLSKSEYQSVGFSRIDGAESCGVNKLERIIRSIGIPINPSACWITLCEPADVWVIIPRSEVVQPN